MRLEREGDATDSVRRRKRWLGFGWCRRERESVRERETREQKKKREKILKIKRKIKIYIKINMIFLKFSFKIILFFKNKHKKWYLCRVKICDGIFKNSGSKNDNLGN